MKNPSCRYYPYHLCYIDAMQRGDLIFLCKILEKFLMITSALTLLIYRPTPLLLLLPNSIQDYEIKLHYE